MSTTLPPGPRMPRALHTLAWLRRPYPFVERARVRYGDVFTIHIGPETFVVLAAPDDVKQVFTGDPAVFHAGEGNVIAGAPLGLAFALANALLFALYIVLAHRVAAHPGLTGVDGLAASMLVAALVICPIGGWAALPALGHPTAVLAGIGVGISSSVVPYVCDQLAMARLSRAAYSLMVALLPATATVVGIVVLAQIPSSTEVVGVALVVGAVGLHRETRPAAH